LRSEGTVPDADDVDTSGAAPELLTNNLHVNARCKGAFGNRTGKGGGSGEASSTTQPSQPPLQVKGEPLTSKVADCGSPSTPAFSAGMQCTGCAQSVLDLNSLNTRGTEAGCLAAVLGACTQLDGYHCVTIRKSGNKVVECSMHMSCGTRNATTNDVQSCLFRAQADCLASSCDNSADASLSSGTRVGAGMLYIAAVGIVLMR